jgi:hypothetical protein
MIGEIQNGQIHAKKEQTMYFNSILGLRRMIVDFFVLCWLYGLLF